MLRPVNVATPAMAVTEFVPESAAAGFPVPDVSVSVTSPVKLTTGLLLASSAAALIAGAMPVPADALDGSCWKTSLLAAPATMSNAVLVEGVRIDPDADRV